MWDNITSNYTTSLFCEVPSLEPIFKMLHFILSSYDCFFMFLHKKLLTHSQNPIVPITSQKKISDIKSIIHCAAEKKQIVLYPHVKKLFSPMQLFSDREVKQSSAFALGRLGQRPVIPFFSFNEKKE